MSIASWSVLALIVLSLSTTFCQSNNLRDVEKQIVDQILDKTKYDSRILPMGTYANGTTGGPVLVRVNMYLRQVDYICTKRQEWKLQITFRHQWNDPRLQYNERNGIKYLQLGEGAEEGRIWKPDTFISNSKTTAINSDLKPNSLVRIYPNGNVLFSTRLTTTSSCPMNLSHYPFDSQICPLQFASYGYTTDDLVYLWKEGDPVQVTKRLTLSGFTYESSDTSYCSSRTNTGEYSCLKGDFYFKRDSSKYVCQWLLPTAVLTLISFISFWLKPNKSKRIKLLVVSLGLLYLQTIYINNKSSPGVSYSTAKDCWLSTCLIFVLAAFIEYGVIRIVDHLNKCNKKDTHLNQNGKSVEEGDTVALKPLVNELKNNQREDNCKQCYTQRWKYSSMSSRIDLISGILFPLAFIIFIIAFLCSHINA